MRRQGSVLVVDDEPGMRYILQCLLESEGYEIRSAADGSTAVAMARQHVFDVAIVDLVMPGLSGADTVRQLKRISTGLEVVVLTGHPTLDTAIGAVHEHVFDYLIKPSDMARLKDVVRLGVQKASDKGLGRRIQDEGAVETAAGNTPRPRRSIPNAVLVGSSPALAKIRARIAEVAPSDLTVLIRGETGTGKEVVARSIHARSGRGPRGSFAKINCPAIPDHLFESEMFGHEKGAFTGAVTQRVGRLELAHEGTVLLDEIGSISPEAQTKLLEVIEHKEFARIGGRYPIQVDIRILGATNAPLESMIEKGLFRADLLYRLQQDTIVVPPLRDHREDIPELVRHFAAKYSDKFAKDVPEIPAEAMGRLCRHHWPGNVRQLDGLMARFSVSGDLAVIEDCLAQAGHEHPAAACENSLQKGEIAAIRHALDQSQGNQRRAASLLGLSYSALRRRMAKYELGGHGNP